MPASLSELKIKSLNSNAEFEAWKSSDKTFFVSNFKDGKKPVRIVLTGELATDGINSKTFDNGPVYSFGLRLTEADSAALEQLVKRIEHDLDAAGLKKWDINNPENDDRIFVKIPLDKTKKKFAVKSNLKLDLKKLDDLDLYRDQTVDVHIDLGAWYNFESSKAGLFLKVTKLDFEHDEPAPKKQKN